MTYPSVTAIHKARAKSLFSSLSPIIIIEDLYLQTFFHSLSHPSRSLIKLQNLGVLMIFNKFILGNLPMFNIHIFAMTDYGMKILEYIK